MYIALLSLPLAEEDDVDQAVDLLHKLVSTWRMNGQVLGDEFSFYERDHAYHTTLTIPAYDALHETYFNKWVQREWSRFPTQGMSHPTSSILGISPDSAPRCECAQRTSFILYTTALSLESSLRCGDCFQPVPLYTIPPTYEHDYYNLIRWETDYQACDRLQMGCETGERFGLREMEHIHSGLTQRGREICRKIEVGTRLPTYYYLHKWKAHSKEAERKRRCPSCGEHWKLAEQLHKLFDFRCVPCRLLSNFAYSFSEPDEKRPRMRVSRVKTGGAARSCD